MRVGVKNSYSSWYEIQMKYRRRSVIGALFLIFVNDLPNWIVNSIMMFEDDTKIWKRVKNIKNVR